MQEKSKNNSPKDCCTKSRIREGDTVLVISGASRGESGKVLACQGNKVLVQGVNFRKKHIKRSEANPNGGTIDLEKPMHISNVRLCTPAGKPVKVKVRRNAQGDKELYYLDGESSVTHRVINQKNR